MCIIIYKNKETKKPSKQLLENCWNTNDDGAGFAVSYDKKIIISKGYMKFDDFWKTAKDLPNNLEIMYHFRIATSGGINPAATHPFPVTGNIEDLRKSDITCDIAVSHNGVLGKGDTKNKLSDTMIFIRDTLSNDFIKNNLRNNIIREYLSLKIDNSKLCLMGTNFETLLIGKFIHDKKTGLYFSNDSYKKIEYENKWYKPYKVLEVYYPSTIDKEKDINDDDYINDDARLCEFCQQPLEIHKMLVHDILECPNCGTLYTFDGEMMLY